MCGALWKRAWVREKEGREGEGSGGVKWWWILRVAVPRGIGMREMQVLFRQFSGHGYSVGCAVVPKSKAMMIPFAVILKSGRNDDSIHQDQQISRLFVSDGHNVQRTRKPLLAGYTYIYLTYRRTAVYASVISLSSHLFLPPPDPLFPCQPPYCSFMSFPSPPPPFPSPLLFLFPLSLPSIP